MINVDLKMNGFYYGVLLFLNTEVFLAYFLLNFKDKIKGFNNNMLDKL